MKRTTLVVAAGLALVAVLLTAPAQAQALRTFVSTTGSDTNPCTITQPCRHFQAAVFATAVGGEVDALDAGSYSPITISQAITINGQGWSYLAPPAGSAAITINAVSGNVTISGVSINGVGVTGDPAGIVFNSGSNLTITDCVVQNVDGGIVMQPSTGAISFAIKNTTLSNNGAADILYFPIGGSATANGVIDHVVATDSSYGMAFQTNFGGGSTTVAISNSIASNNSVTGIYFINASGALQGSIDNSTISGNATYGIDAEVASDLEIGRSVITYNGTGVENNTTPDRVFSYGDNRINSNGTNIGGMHGATLTQSHALQ